MSQEIDFTLRNDIECRYAHINRLTKSIIMNTHPDSRLKSQFLLCCVRSWWSRYRSAGSRHPTRLQPI